MVPPELQIEVHSAPNPGGRRWVDKPLQCRRGPASIGISTPEQWFVATADKQQQISPLRAVANRHTAPEVPDSACSLSRANGAAMDCYHSEIACLLLPSKAIGTHD
jgi:hypothetical protein